LSPHFFSNTAEPSVQIASTRSQEVSLEQRNSFIIAIMSTALFLFKRFTNDKCIFSFILKHILSKTLNSAQPQKSVASSNCKTEFVFYQTSLYLLHHLSDCAHISWHVLDSIMSGIV
jgi:hypothetical protein